MLYISALEEIFKLLGFYYSYTLLHVLYYSNNPLPARLPFCLVLHQCSPSPTPSPTLYWKSLPIYSLSLVKVYVTYHQISICSSFYWFSLWADFYIRNGWLVASNMWLGCILCDLVCQSYSIVSLYKNPCESFKTNRLNVTPCKRNVNTRSGLVTLHIYVSILPFHARKQSP